MAVGQGESLNVLAELMQIKPQDKDRFFKVSKANFGEIYSTNNQNTLQVLASLQNVMAKDEVFKSLRISLKLKTLSFGRVFLIFNDKN